MFEFRLQAARSQNENCCVVEPAQGRGANGSWEEFFDLYHGLIRNIARRSGMTPEEAQDVIQEGFLDLARKLTELKYDVRNGSFKKFLKTLIGSRVLDQRRKRLPYAMPDHLVPEGRQIASPNPMEESWEMEWRHNLIDAARERIGAKIDLRQYSVFDLATSRNRPPSEISKLRIISRPGVYLATHRVAYKAKLKLRLMRG